VKGLIEKRFTVFVKHSYDSSRFNAVAILESIPCLRENDPRQAWGAEILRSKDIP
jgi:hypothetical protein